MEITSLKKTHPVAERLEEIIRRKLADRVLELDLSQEDVGGRTFRSLGWQDNQKKAGNLLSGRTKMKISDFYILCEGLELIPDRVFASAVEEALRHEVIASTPQKKEGLKSEILPGRPALPGAAPETADQY